MVPDGTCYFASSATAALRERLGAHAHSNRVPASVLANVVVSRSELRLDGDLADSCHGEAIRVVGMNREVHTTADYETTRVWATHLRDLGHGGIRYQPRHTMGPSDFSFAIFGPQGVERVAPDFCTPASEAAAEAGLTVLPDAPDLKQVRVIRPARSR